MLKFLPKVRSLTSRMAGFTMIELLIVITILGILAVAVLSAINPIEQINRGRDTSAQSDAEQLLNAIERFNAFQGHFPWDISRSTSTVDTGVPFTLVASTDTPWLVSTGGGPIPGNPLCTVLDRLGPTPDAVSATETCVTGSNEVKPTYINRVNGRGLLRGLYIYKEDESQNTDMYVCFAPQSTAFLEQARQRCTDTENPVPADYPPPACTDTGTAAAGNPNGRPMICLP